MTLLKPPHQDASHLGYARRQDEWVLDVRPPRKNASRQRDPRDMDRCVVGVGELPARELPRLLLRCKLTHALEDRDRGRRQQRELLKRQTGTRRLDVEPATLTQRPK